MKYAQLVVGPAGSGKSTYCYTIQEHCRAANRPVMICNLDPAADYFKYQPDVDVRDLISVKDVQEDEELILGPNGALVFCMEYLLQEIDALQEMLQAGEDDYFLFDCPGQIELYSHLPVMRQLTERLQQWGFQVCTVFLLDSQFLLDADKFIAGALTTLATMVSLETPAVSIISKMDMMQKEDKEWIEGVLEGNAQALLDSQEATEWNKKHRLLSELIASILDEYGLVRFVTLDCEDEENISEVLLTIDNSIQYGEDADVRDRLPEDEDVESPEDQGFVE
ncbi:unnamed protein product [Bursaphelenchus okinawaensis]|uniref:GPN-loop GTPase 3 n=1 Tax=Bursaphelenchus okinawaensis TaxID=465554 RepID=A0A811L5C8_9BILA|nr:unnamed protein product [Bursaphelenchus okinawaensis]CAG9117900.1 unnamed protein product [Bursaphelenchus okinawaensis]